jgi:gamma-glutamylaminecyclotransferase
VTDRSVLLFVYGTLLPGETSHARLDGARALGPARTTPAYDLYDLGPYPALVDGGATAVVGELFEVPLPMLAALDVYEQVPILFQRARVALDDGRVAQTYVLARDQVRGRRRIRSGDWRGRFRAEPTPGAREAAIVQWARKRPR